MFSAKNLKLHEDYKVGLVIKCLFGFGWNSWNARLHFSFFFFFFTYFRSIFLLFIHCYGYCLWTVAVKFDFFYFSAQILLFIDPQILLFNNFFIKNGFHGTIHTFKIILLQCFSVFSFSFQFSAVSKWILK